MLFSRPIFRRYTPPTCTLEITAKSAPLSPWSRGTSWQNLRFELCFDDPRLPAEKQLTIEGDRRQLELLCDVITNYVQDFLKLSSLPGSAPAPLALPPATSATTASQVSAIQTESSQLESERHTDQLPLSFPSAPFCQTKGLLSHELFLGSLANATSGTKIQLSTTQLCDLANALAEYRTAIATPTQFSRPRRPQAANLWAAAVLLVATGLTALGVKWYQSNRALQATTALQDQQAQQFGEANPNSGVPLAPNSAVPSPNLPPSLSARGKLPPPPTVSAAQQPIRPQSQPLSVPVPTSTLPLPPTPGSVSPGTAISVTPRSPQTAALPNLPPPPAPANIVDPNDVEALSPGFSEDNRGRLNLPKLAPLQSPSSDAEVALEGGGSAPESVAANQANRGTARGTARENAPSATLLDTIPQVAEARQYFQQRWQPPEGITQTLEYRLVLNQDGSLQRIIPLGQAAKIYLDQTGMPLLNESFVSPLQIAGNPQIRLILGTDGTVKTFLE